MDTIGSKSTHIRGPQPTAASVPTTTTMAEDSFRASLNQFRWARGTTDDSRNPPPPADAGGPFSRFYNSVSSYVPLRSADSSNEEQAYLALSHWERYVPPTPIFCTCSLSYWNVLDYWDSLVALLDRPYASLSPLSHFPCSHYGQASLRWHSG